MLPRRIPAPSDVLDSIRGPAGLYLHVPFCSSVCPFCPYNKVVYRESLARTYFDALDEGRLPIARRARLGELRGSMYYTFWQAFTGRLDPRRCEGLFRIPRWPTAVARLFAATGLATPDGDRVRLTPRGLDRYHDVERWVTYQLIEPLWQDLMREHHRDREPERIRADHPLWRALAGMEPVAAS